MRTAKTLIRLGAHAILLVLSCGGSNQWVPQAPSFLHADSEYSDQTGRMPKLIWDLRTQVFFMRTAKTLIRLGAYAIMLVLLCGVSNQASRQAGPRLAGRQVGRQADSLVSNTVVAAGSDNSITAVAANFRFILKWQVNYRPNPYPNNDGFETERSWSQIPENI